MTNTAASFDGVPFFGGREFTLGDGRALIGRLLTTAALGIAAVAAVGASTAAVTVTGLWMVGVTYSDAPHIQARQPAGPARLALADPAAFAKSSFEAKWAGTTSALAMTGRVATRPVAPAVARARRGVEPREAQVQPKDEVVNLKDEVAEKAALPLIAELTPPATAIPSRRAPESPKPAARVTSVPLPRAKPELLKSAQAPAARPALQRAALTPAPRQSEAQAPLHAGRTALYDITGKAVYMPDGERLEAHSGLGFRRDNPRFVKVKNKGPTPPNVYKLSLRKRLFHGVRAVRMTPVDERKMFGRDGMLAHSYLLGASGQSNGCVSIKNYDRFLQAFLKGKVDRIVVVRNLDEAPRQLASLARAQDRGGNQFAANEVTGSTW